MSSSDGLELNIAQIRLHSGYKTCMSCPKSIPAVYIGHTPMWICHIPPTGRGRLSTMGASSPLECCSLKQEIAKKALFEKENLDASHGIRDIVSICGLITREAAGINQILP